MSRIRERKDCWTSPCECLEQAFLRARTGVASASTMSCSSKDCPVREVEPGVVADFLEFIGELRDEPPSKLVASLR